MPPRYTVWLLRLCSSTKSCVCVAIELPPAGYTWLMTSAFVIYVAAVVTDYLDGYLARKWKVEGAFGRVVDPFADKILVCGTLIMLVDPLLLDSPAMMFDVPRVTGAQPEVRPDLPHPEPV